MAANAANYDSIKTAHASLGSAAWVFIFPLGSIVMALIRHRRVWIFHAGLQIAGLLAITVGSAMGIWMARDQQELNSYHPIIGLVIFTCAWIQAVAGYIAHIIYKRRGMSNVVGRVHVWAGRVLITIGMINGGLGLLLSADGTRNDYIAYGATAGSIWVLFGGVSAYRDWSRARSISVDEKNTPDQL